MKQSRKKWFVAAICIIIVLALGTGGVIYYKKQEQQKTIINNKQRAVNKLCHSLTSAVHRSLFYLQFAIYHILFIIPSSPSATPIMIRLLQSV